MNRVMPNRQTTDQLRIGSLSRPRRHHDRRWWSLLASVTFTCLMAGASLTVAADGHDAKDISDYPAVPPEQLAEVIIVILPHTTFALNRPEPTDRIVQGDIIRIEKGVLPTTIVHTRNTIGAPLRAGVPVKLYLKAFKDGHAHYIINAFPEWYGGQP